MRIKSAVTLVGVDDSIAEVVPLLVKRWQELVFDDDGVVLVDGRRREGLALVAGEHARAGARYEVVTAGERPGHYVAEVVADSPTEVRVRVDRAGDVPIEVTVAKGASKVDATFDGSVEGLAGTVRGTAALDLDRLQEDAPQLVGSIEHDRVVGVVKAWVRPGWTVDVEADVRGKGLLRPVVAPMLWLRGKRVLTKILEKRAAEIRALSERLGSPLDPVVVADKIADDFLADVVPYKLRT
ncbi:hypothetical protein SAMN05192558_110115 [Actinokineospora alba]|uniref:Uncharacterized protein n=1 Tax=Actinokineospora alba TaxID=504798 RepID=A0A1H0TQ96_9PSEU|nr:hypothetical protein [Actinokineospora alba]TDP70644.1 hypothetical protein C8E96_6265 [Actinokineospora alba]SDJ12384.1 hypothetical protein SAMN05421871_110115 [Actinokineospora alba]SDP55955.1 hypothetical protein SAMN05192558_110115 [Actinokineospora alba]